MPARERYFDGGAGNENMPNIVLTGINVTGDGGSLGAKTNVHIDVEEEAR